MDGGDELHAQEDGCGALTGWNWTDATSTSFAKVYFNLPIILTAGCVERAIVSAGGPQLSCTYDGIAGISKRQQHDAAQEDEWMEEDMRREKKAREEDALGKKALAADMVKRAITTEGPQAPTITATPTYSYLSTISSMPSYTPMSWDANNTVVLTWTLTKTDTTFTSAVWITRNTTGMTTFTTTISITPSMSTPSSTVSA